MILSLVATLAACAPGGGPQQQAADSSPNKPALAATIVTTLPVGDHAVSSAFDGRYLWVASASGVIAQVDTTIDQVIRTVKLRGRPVGVAVTPEGVWVADNGGDTVTRLNAGTGQPNATVHVGANPLGFAQVDRDLWVFSQAAQQANVIDPRTARVTRTVPLPGLGGGYPAIAGGGIWVPDLAGTTRSVWRVEPDTGQVTRRIPTEAHPAEIAFAFSSGWVTDDQGVIRFDPATGKEQARVTGVGRQLDGIETTPDAVWVVSVADNLLSKIDPATNRATASISVCTGPRHLTVVHGDVWVTCFDAGILVKVHPG
jgi:YVTN family beta-propeller protein